jgi:hypothetical protein
MVRSKYHRRYGYTVKVEALAFPGTLAKTCELTQRHDREENKTNLRPCVIFKSRTSESTVELGYNFMKVRFVVINERCLTEVYNAMVNSEELICFTEQLTVG